MAASGNVAAGLPNLGHTYHGGTPTSVGRSKDLEGTEAYFKDEVAQTGMAPALKRSGRTKVCRLVRNSSGAALLPKRLVSWETGYRGLRVDGYVAVTNGEPAGVVDDQLPAGGAADDDLFWVIRKGPALCLNAIASGAGTVITEGSLVGALTAATTGATTAGRIANLTATTGDTITNRVGRAMTARTTANTNADVLVDLDMFN